MEKYLFKQTKKPADSVINNNINNSYAPSTSSSTTTTSSMSTFTDPVQDELEQSEEETNTNLEMEHTASVEKRKTAVKRKFNDVWKGKFGAWIEDARNMNINVHTHSDCSFTSFCKCCNKTINGGLTHMVRHEKTELHQANLAKMKNTPSVEIFFNKQKNTSTSVYGAELKLIMFLHEHRLPFLLMDHLPHLIRSICPDSEIAKSIKCSRTKATSITKDCIGAEAVEVLKNKIGNNFYSIIIDETTDVAVQKSLAVVIRYFDEQKMQVCDAFLSLLRITTGTAENIFKAVCNCLEMSNLPIANMAGLAADNASVMMGDVKGVKARFREILPHLFVMRCTCHSFHLCSSAAACKLPKSVECFTRDVYNHFSNSSNRMQDFTNFQTFLNLKPHKLLRPSQTRWLSVQAAVDRILENWDALQLYFRNAVHLDNLHTSQTILNCLENPVYKLYITFLSYILDIVNKLNLEFQSEMPKIHVLMRRISELYKTILRNFVTREYVDSTDLEKINPANPHIFLNIDKMYFGARADLLIKSINKDEVKSFQLKALDFYVELCSQIKKRFSFNDELLIFVQTFEVSNVMSSEMTSIASKTVKYFNHVIDFNDLEKLDSEWRIIQDVDELKKSQDLDFLSFWIKVMSLKNSLNEVMFPLLSKLMKHIFVLPHSSAAAERVFSQLTLIKTKTRNKLNVETCDSILHAQTLLKHENASCYEWVPSETLLRKKPKYS